MIILLLGKRVVEKYRPKKASFQFEKLYSYFVETVTHPMQYALLEETLRKHISKKFLLWEEGFRFTSAHRNREAKSIDNHTGRHRENSHKEINV